MLHNGADIEVTDLRGSALVALGVLAWRLIIWKRNRSSPPTSTSTKLLPSPTTIVFPASPPPAYSPGLMKTSPTSPKKSTPALSLDVNCDVEATEPSPIRSASFNPSTKTQSISSRVSSRMSVGAKKLYVDHSSWHSIQRRYQLIHLILTALD